MLDKFFSWSLDLFAFVTPVSIAATNIVFFPMAAVWAFGGRQVWSRWNFEWGQWEEIFLVFLGISLLSALFGLDIRHSLKEIKNKDSYILISIVLVALVKEEDKNARLIKLFMTAGLLTAIFGLLQYVIGVDQSDKSNGFFFHLPMALAHWPRPILNLLSLLNGRVMGTRGHPLAYAECLLFNWAFALCFLISSKGRDWLKWLLYLVLIGAALLVSQSRGPWIAAGVMLIVIMLTSLSRRSWILLALGLFFAGLFAAVPVMRSRAKSILDTSHFSNKERLHMWHAGAVLWKSHPLLGIGPGNVKAVSADFETADERVWGEWGHLHSTYINFLAERGTLGLLLFLAWMTALCLELGKAIRFSTEDLYAVTVYKATLLGILGFLIGGLTETSYNTAVVKMMLFFVVGLALALARHEKRPTS